MENLGKVGELQIDGSPLQLGVQGEYDGKAFQIVGRIQLRFKDGYWNEWYLYYSSGETGWLGEAVGEYFVNTQAKLSSQLPSSSQLGLGDSFSMAGETFVVTGKTTNSVSAFEGELPFIVDQTEPFSAVDLRSVSGAATTIDYSDHTPTLFLGEYKAFDSFNFAGLRGEGEAPSSELNVRAQAGAVGVEKFNCPTCGAPHSVEGGVRTKLLVCEYCGSGVDVTSTSLNVVWREQAMRKELSEGAPISLGSVAQIDGLEFKLIGYLKKSIIYEGISYPWLEYLLHHRTHGYRWLVENDRHYALLSPLPSLPVGLDDRPAGRPNSGALQFGGKKYRHFQTGSPRIDALAGEFYWKVKRGQQSEGFEYISPPYSLMADISEHDIAWSLAEYKTARDIRVMFDMPNDPPPGIGVAPAQPNPHESTAKSVWRTFKLVSLVSFVLLLSGVISGSKGSVFKIPSTSYQTFRANPAQESKPFKISGHGNVAFKFTARPSERWVFIKASLVNRRTKAVFKAGATLERFRGQGETTQQVRVPGVPSGMYTLRWEVQSGTTSLKADKVDGKKKSVKVPYSIEIYRGVRVWGWFFLLMILLVLIPLYVSSVLSRFETKRWYNSDYG